MDGIVLQPPTKWPMAVDLRARARLSAPSRSSCHLRHRLVGLLILPSTPSSDSLWNDSVQITHETSANAAHWERQSDTKLPTAYT